jgi:O-antigen/teichoic acid export membrane protein
VGDYALLRVLPWLGGTVVTLGMDGAIVYFLANQKDTRHVRATILAFLGIAAPVGVLGWVGVAPLLRDVFFAGLPVGVVALAGLLILSRMIVMTAKVAAQGRQDLTGSNRTHLLEGAMFLPWYAALLGFGADPGVAIVPALIAGDATTALFSWGRLIRRGFLDDLGRPSLAVARQMCSFGIRVNVGEWVYLLNLRINVVLVGAIAGPAAVGIYAVAARFAEILQLPGMAMNYVLMPRFSAGREADNARETRFLLPRVLAVATVAAVPLAFPQVDLAQRLPRQDVVAVRRGGRGDLALRGDLHPGHRALPAQRRQPAFRDPVPDVLDLPAGPHLRLGARAATQRRSRRAGRLGGDHA